MQAVDEAVDVSSMLLIGPGLPQLEQVRSEFPHASLTVWEETEIASDVASVPVDDLDVILVFAETHDEQQAMNVCESLRRRKRWQDIPILVVITIYQMILGNNVQKVLSNASFVFHPIRKEELFRRLKELG